jgi:signal recognition particle subunit SEC65
MNVDDFEVQEGGVKIVFDVSEPSAEEIARAVRTAGFDVRRYYHPEDEHEPGGSAPGYLRLGAERPMHEFTQAEQTAIVAAFDDTMSGRGFSCERVGVDVWTAGNRDGLAGVREPRRPRPLRAAGAVGMQLP